MNRRDFVFRSSLALSAGFASRSWLQAQPAGAAPSGQATTVSFLPLRRGVGAFVGRGGTIGYLVTDGAVVAVDTQFPDTAGRFAAELPGRKARPFDVIINTHHHGDHVGGNAVLRGSTKEIVAHVNVPQLLEERAAQDKRSLDPQVLPTQTFSETWKRDLGDEQVSGRYFGPAHTKGDIMVFFEKANVVHTGDLMFNRKYPVIDRAGGGTVRGWIEVLEKATKHYAQDTQYIFGHSGTQFPITGNRGDILVFRDFLSAVVEHVQKQIAAGKSRTEVIAMDNFARFAEFHEPAPNRLSGLLGATYDELLTRAG
ncbi:MAG TPA: MBL fold metallo-hydrolase [Opitutaceae bacterium]|nr:MBL fold metallo-hydrolase [Opitutaceae bacterium]